MLATGLCFSLVRSCYHPDAVDDHGDFRGGIDEFLAYIQQGLPRFERTMHFIGNVLVEPDGDRARAESYIVAYHHLRESRTKPDRGIVTFEHQGINQRGEIVCSCVRGAMMMRRSA